VKAESSLSSIIFGLPKFVELFVGAGAARVRGPVRASQEKAPLQSSSLTNQMRSANPVPARWAWSAANDEREQTLTQLLTEMDGFASTDQPVKSCWPPPTSPKRWMLALLRPPASTAKVLVESARSLRPQDDS